MALAKIVDGISQKISEVNERIDNLTVRVLSAENAVKTYALQCVGLCVKGRFEEQVDMG